MGRTRRTRGTRRTRPGRARAGPAPCGAAAALRRRLPGPMGGPASPQPRVGAPAPPAPVVPAPAAAQERHRRPRASGPVEPRPGCGGSSRPLSTRCPTSWGRPGRPRQLPPVHAVPAVEAAAQVCGFQDAGALDRAGVAHQPVRARRQQALDLVRRERRVALQHAGRRRRRPPPPTARCRCRGTSAARRRRGPALGVAVVGERAGDPQADHRLARGEQVGAAGGVPGWSRRRPGVVPACSLPLWSVDADRDARTGRSPASSAGGPALAVVAGRHDHHDPGPPGVLHRVRQRVERRVTAPSPCRTTGSAPGCCAAPVGHHPVDRRRSPARRRPRRRRHRP